MSQAYYKLKEVSSRAEDLLGSHIEIKLPIEDSKLHSSCFDIIKDIEEDYSRFRDSSKLSYLNRNLGVWQPVSDEMLLLLQVGLELRKRTHGSFDITLKDDLDALGYDKDYSFEIKPKKKPGLFSKVLEPVRVDARHHRVFLRKEIDFGGLGKGYAMDKVADFLDSKHLERYYINAGGDILTKGSWPVLLEHPDDSSRAIGKIDLDGRSLACSAPNRRKWRGVHHLINAKTGMPENSVKAIFVLASKGLLADAYATALFCSGFEQAVSMSKELPVEVLVISSDDKMYRSKGFKVEFF